MERKYLKLKWRAIRGEYVYKTMEHMLDEIGVGLENREFVRAGEWEIVYMVKEYERDNMLPAKDL